MTGSRRLVGTGAALMAGTLAQAGLGLVFWVVAARAFPVRILGVDAALITTMTALALVGQLNLGNALVRFLPQRRERAGRWIAGAYAIAVGTAGTLAAAFAVLAPSLSSDLGTLGGAASAAGYTAAVAAWVVFVLQDAVLVAMRRAGWTVVENVVFGALKLAALPVVAAAGVRHGVFVAWVAPLALLVPAVNVLIVTRLLGEHGRRAVAPGELLRSSRRRLLAFLGQDYLAVVLSQAALATLPLAVVALLGDRANAYFYVAFTLATLLDVLVYNAVTALVVEGAHAEDDLPALARVAVVRLLAPLAAAALLLVAAAPLALRVFGPDYPHEATGVLRLLACALPFRAAVFLFDAVCRIEGRGGRILATHAAGFAALVPLTLVLAGPLGLAGVGIAWLAASALVAAVVTPLLARTLGWRVARPRLGPERALPLAAFAVCAAAPAVVAAGAPPAARLAAVLAFVAIVPGTALLSPWLRRGLRPAPGFVAAAGLAVSVLAAQAMLWAGVWSPLAGLRALAGGCLLVLLAALRPAPRAPAGHGPLWVGEVELAGGLPAALAMPVRPGSAYIGGRLLVRVHGQPLGFVTVPVVDGRIGGAAIGAAVEAQLGRELAARPPCPRPALGRRPTVSVVVCTRDRAASLAVALRSILAGDEPPLELIVVDNAPRTSATRDVVAALGDPRVRYLLEERPGLSRARNTGAAAATGELVAFTDDDVVADPGWVDALSRGFARAHHVGLVTGMVPAAELETPAQQYFEAKVQWSGSCVPRLYDLAEHRDPHPLYPYSAGLFGTGANFAVRALALREIGAFDEALGAGSPAQGGEDLDYFLRAILAGWAIAYEPAALVWHVHRRDDAALAAQMWGYGAGLGAYVFKHLRERRVALSLLRVLPRGILRFARLSHGVTRTAPVPPAAQRTELRGLLAGPGTYVRGRRALRELEEVAG